MKKIFFIIVAIFFMLVGYGALVGFQQNQSGVSLFQAVITYNSMNPVSRIGYSFMLKRNHGLVENANKLMSSLDENDE